MKKITEEVLLKDGDYHLWLLTLSLPMDIGSHPNFLDLTSKVLVLTPSYGLFSHLLVLLS